MTSTVTLAYELPTRPHHLYHHEAIVSTAPWPDDVPVPVFGPRMHVRDHRRRRAAELA